MVVIEDLSWTALISSEISCPAGEKYISREKMGFRDAWSALEKEK